MLKTSRDAYRFWKYVLLGDGCWEWAGGRMPKGYGIFAHDGRQGYAHRASYKMHHGPIPPGMSVLHRCDNPACVRPNHLFLGTRGDNNRDCMTKGRNAFGEKCGRSKLTAEQVLSIRKDSRACRAVAADYGVNAQSIWNIRNRITWKHLPDHPVETAPDEYDPSLDSYLSYYAAIDAIRQRNL
jgi:hypothetical protein